MMNHNEIVILENAGLDKFTLAKPALFIATLCCLLCFFISFFLMPYANKKLRTIRTDFNHNYANLLISPGIFENLNSLTIYAKNRDSSNSLSGILIYDRRNPEHSSAITSESGVLSQKGNSVLLYLGKGTAQKFNYKTRKTDILNFDSYVVNLQDSNKAEISLKWKAGERYINELLNPEGEVSDKNLRKYYVELHQRIIYPFLSVVLAFIACAFILNQQFKRHGNIAHNVKAVIAASIFVGFLMAGFDLIQNFPRLVGLLYADLLIFVFLSYLILKPKTKN
ncbi:MAG: lipopolysaccharide export LptBFGC system permease protein LptF [Rickettsiales bacterium]|jgi:lipopolysaccharide export LptBFGC system permease protein LptF